MTMVRDITLIEAQQLGRALDEASGEAFQMDEQAFRTFYDRTARLLWSYLYRGSGNDAALADDLLQETYYRFLRARLPEMNQDYMKNYLFRIGTNLMRDHWRQRKSEPARLLQAAGLGAKGLLELAAGDAVAEAIHARSDVSCALGSMKPRERELLWLAYVEGSSHREIAQIVGLKEHSVRPLLFRARQKLVLMLRGRGLGPKASGS